MGQYMDYNQGYDQRGHTTDQEFEQSRQNWSSNIHQYTVPQGEKVVETDIKIKRRTIAIIAMVVSLILWCVFAWTIVIADGVANVSPSPSAEITQILLVLGLLLFTFFVCATNILLHKILFKKR